MRAYILKILLKHPIGRTTQENKTLVDYVFSTVLNNENWFKELQYFHKIDKLLDNEYQKI